MERVEKALRKQEGKTLEERRGELLELKEKVKKIKFLFPELEGVPEEEILKAVALAKYYNLDPLKKQVYFVPFRMFDTLGDKKVLRKVTVQLVVSYLEYVKRAERSGKLNGWNIKIEDLGNDMIARVTIWRKDWEKEFVWEVYLSEVKKDTRSWREMPKFMLKKVAIAQAFRIAFPEETQELPYEEAEIITEPEVIEVEVKKESEKIEAVKPENAIKPENNMQKEVGHDMEGLAEIIEGDAKFNNLFSTKEK